MKQPSSSTNNLFKIQRLSQETVDKDFCMSPYKSKRNSVNMKKVLSPRFDKEVVRMTKKLNIKKGKKVKKVKKSARVREEGLDIENEE